MNIKEAYDEKVNVFLDEALYNYDLGLPENAYIRTDKILEKIDIFSKIIYESDEKIGKLEALYTEILEQIWYILKRLNSKIIKVQINLMMK